MFLCPITSNKLRSAFARGVNIWYSPESEGRLITLAAARKLIGPDATQELWIRSEVKTEGESWKHCPSCSKAMKIVIAPKWAGSYEVDVCRNCHILWLDKDKFPQVPGPEDLLSPYADGSIVSSVAREEAKISVAIEAKEHRPISGDGPEAFWKILPAAIGFPVEMDDVRKVGLGWMTWMLGLALVLIHTFLTAKDSSLISSWGFTPGDPWKHFGLTFLSYGFLHADWFHLVSNLYFFGVFADDVEIYYGKVKFLILILGCLFFSSFATMVFSGKPEIPHVGLSGAISALMVNYGLIYRKSRIAFMLPFLHIAVGGALRRFGWYRIASFWVILFYVVKDLFYFLVFELDGLTHVSHSGHLQGAFFGFCFWLLNGCPNWYYDSVPTEHVSVKEKLLPYK